MVNPRLLSGSAGSPAASGRRPVHLQLPPATAPPLSPNPEPLAQHSLHSLLLRRPCPTAQAANSEISRTERTQRTTCRLGAAPAAPTAAVESYRGRTRRGSADDAMARRNGEVKRRTCAKTEKASPLAPALAREMRLGSGEHARPDLGVHSGVRVAAGGVPPCQQLVGPGGLKFTGGIHLAAGQCACSALALP